MKIKILEKFKAFTWQQIVALIILAAADVFVIAAPYYIKNIVPNLHIYLGIHEDDVARLTAIIGWVTLATQLPGGFLANRFSSRKLLFLAVLSTGILTFWFGAIILKHKDIGYQSAMAQYSVVFGLWGINSTLIFWTPLWKLVSQQTTKENQGLAYGIQGTANGIIGFIFVFVIGLIITTVWYNDKSTTNSTVPFSVYAFLIATFLVITSFLVLFLVKEKPLDKSQITKISWEKFKASLLQVWTSLKNWKLWMLSIFVMGMYTFQSVFAYYLIQMLQNAFLAPVVLVTILGGVRTYALRFAVSSYIGYLADKFKSYILFLIFASVIGLLLVLIIILLAFISSNYSTVVIVLSSILFLLVGVLSWAMVTLRYSQVGEIEIGKNNYASSVGILSFIGFSTDAWLYEITEAVGKAYTDPGHSNTNVTGYQIILAITLGITLLGVLCALVVFIANTIEMKKSGKTNYRWRELHNA